MNGIDRSPAAAACMGKQGYPNRGAALKVLKSRERKRRVRSQGGRLDAYQCPACRHWHLGTYRRPR